MKLPASFTSAIIRPMTITLSMTASMNRPKDDTTPRSRAILPSSQSVSAAAMYSQNAIVAAQANSAYINATTMNISGTREIVSRLGRFMRAEAPRNHSARRRRQARNSSRASRSHLLASAGLSRFAPAGMRHCIYPGTFDPITYGHLDVLARAAKLFDRVTVAVAESAGKAPLFPSAHRLEMIRPNVAQFPHVTVTTFGGLLVEFCIAQKADAIIRGLRALSNFEF